MKSLLEFVFFGRTMNKMLYNAANALQADADCSGFEKNEFENLMARKHWNHAARKLITFGEAQENNDQKMGIKFWTPLAKATNMMKMGDMIILCQQYRDGLADRPENKSLHSTPPAAGATEGVGEL